MKALFLTTVILAGFATAEARPHQPIARPWLGMALAVRTSPTGAKFLYVVQIGPGTPAAKAGMRAGDLITAFDGKKVESRDELDVMELVARLKVGRKLRLSVTRAGTPLQKVVLVEGLPPEYESAWRSSFERATQERAAAKP
jgi:S1-C subfamily serine protease